MEIGLIGLGRMGGNMAQRLLSGGHSVVGFDIREENIREAVQAGVRGAGAIRELVTKLKAPRAVWAMVPNGSPTEETIDMLIGLLEPNDVIVDGGNSRYTDSMKAAERCARKGLHFLDVGVSGGIWGLQEGYCLMIGGPREAFERLEPVFKTLAPPQGYARVGPSGAGHFVKMVHNGIEYGMLQAYAEGFELLKARQEFGLDLRQIAELWQHGTVIRSWLLELAERAFRKDAELASLRGWVEDSGEGRWTVIEAVEQAVPLPAIAESLFARFRSRQEQSFAAKVIAALRAEFGGHAVEALDD
ncbi:MAG: decarboxylating 6-phosphogluconate dehydrogenase [Gemmatimonadetes bacterium]|nr:decarboxylating 6-phosphogluconate dehydrogenase [Gemmatimonadota bacterium]